MQQVPFTLAPRRTYRILSGILATWATLALASPRAQAACPFAKSDQPAKLVTLLISGTEAFKEGAELKSIGRGLAKQPGIVQTLLSQALIQQLLPVEGVPEKHLLQLSSLLASVSDGGRNFSVSRLRYPSAPELGDVYRVQIVYYSQAPDAPNSDELAEHVAHLYYARVAHVGWLTGNEPTRSQVDFRLLGTVIDGQSRSCFIK